MGAILEKLVFAKVILKILNAIAYVGGVFFALVEIAFVIILFAIGFSNPYLSIALISVAGFYIVFTLVNLLFLEKPKTQRVIKIICRYAKYGMRLIHMAFVIVGLISLSGVDQLLPIVGVVILLISLVISLTLDTTRLACRLVIRRIKWQLAPNNRQEIKVDPVTFIQE